MKKWKATVKYHRPGNRVIIYTAIRYYDIICKGTRAVKLDRTRVIRDLVPDGCTTVDISIRQTEVK